MSSTSDATPPTSVVTPDDHSAYLIVVSVILLIWMLMTWGLRVIIRTRFNGPWKIDDTLATAGTITAIIQVAVLYNSIHYGLGKKLFLIDSTNLIVLEKYLFASQILYIVAVALSKISTSQLIARLTRASKQVRFAHGLSIFISIWTVVSILLISIRCSSTSPWDLTGKSCAADPFDRWIAIEVVFAFVEVFLFGLSFYLVWSLHMENRLKIIVVGAFVCRLLVIVPIGMRLYYLRPIFFLDDATFTSLNALILTQVNMHYSLMACTIPCTRPFIKAFHGYLDNEDVAGTSTGGWSNAQRSKERSGYVLHSVSSGQDSELKLNKQKSRRSSRRPSRPIITVDSVLADQHRGSNFSGPTVVGKDKVTPIISGPNSPISPSAHTTQSDLGKQASRTSLQQLSQSISNIGHSPTSLSIPNFSRQTSANNVPQVPSVSPTHTTPFAQTQLSSASTARGPPSPNVLAMLRPDQGQVYTTVEHNPALAASHREQHRGAHRGRAPSDDSTAERDEDMVIHQTRDFEVTYERTG